METFRTTVYLNKKARRLIIKNKTKDLSSASKIINLAIPLYFEQVPKRIKMKNIRAKKKSLPRTVASLKIKKR